MESLNNLEAGSDRVIGPAFVLIGKLQRTHGVRGEIVMRVMTDFPQRIRKGRKVFLGEGHHPMVIASVRSMNDLLLLAFEGILNKEDAQQLTNLAVFAAIKDLPVLPAGKYYHHQLIGLQVYEGEELVGSLADVLETGANDVYVVLQLDGKELLLPAIKSVILNIDLEAKQMLVCIPEGLRG